MDYELKDSGNRTKFQSGAQRDVQMVEKGRYDLLSPVFLRRVAVVCAKGGVKYFDRNWELGMPMSRFMDSAMRHLWQWWNGHTDEDHLHQAGWNLMAASHTLHLIELGLLPKELDDRPCYENGFRPPTARCDQCGEHRPLPQMRRVGELAVCKDCHEYSGESVRPKDRRECKHPVVRTDIHGTCPDCGTRTRNWTHELPAAGKQYHGPCDSPHCVQAAYVENPHTGRMFCAECAEPVPMSAVRRLDDEA